MALQVPSSQNDKPSSLACSTTSVKSDTPSSNTLRGDESFYNIHRYTFEQVDDPTDCDSAFLKASRPLGCCMLTENPMDTVHNANAVPRAILLAAILSNNTGLLSEGFFSLCYKLTAMENNTWVPDSRTPIEVINKDPAALLPTHRDQCEHWRIVAAFQHARATFIEAAAAYLEGNRITLQRQRCHMYDTTNPVHIQGLQAVLDLLAASDDFDARAYINANFGDIISSRALPYAQPDSDLNFVPDSQESSPSINLEPQ